MDYCPHCSKELPVGTLICDSCGRTIAAGIGPYGLPKNFWMTLAGAFSILVLTLFNWVSVPLDFLDPPRTIGFNLINFFGNLTFGNQFFYVFQGFHDINTMRTITMILLFMMVAAFALLIISLIKYRSKLRKIFAFSGFALTALIPIGFTVAYIAVSGKMDGLTIYPLLTVFIAVVSLGFFVNVPRRIRWAFYVMLIPGFVLTAIYSYGPLVGLVIAFQRFNIASGLFGSEWIGLENFRFIFGMRDFSRALRNTIYIASLKIIFNMGTAILVALLLNEIRHVMYKRTVQTLIYLPFFISWVIVSGIFLEILSLHGIVNSILGTLGMDPVMFFHDTSVFPWVLILTEVWKGFGWGTIIYLAAMVGIDPGLYEAAAIDGANRFRRVLHITLPGIVPIIVLSATLNLGNVLNAGFDQVVTMYNPTVYETGDIIDTLVFRVGIRPPAVHGMGPRYEIATAIGMFRSVVSFFLVSTAYFFAYKFADYRIF